MRFCLTAAVLTAALCLAPAAAHADHGRNDEIVLQVNNGHGHAQALQVRVQQARRHDDNVVLQVNQGGRRRVLRVNVNGDRRRAVNNAVLQLNLNRHDHHQASAAVLQLVNRHCR